MGKTAAEKRYVRDLNARLPEGVNRCSFCGLFKGDDQFSPAQRWDGSKRKASYECRTCSTARARRYRATLAPELKKERGRKWHLKTLYNVTIERYDEMMARQGGVCAICQGANADGRELAVDHDHTCCEGRTSCGKCVRGLLCDNCNRGIGHLGDSVERLMIAAKYLGGEHGANS